jgi:putative ABC transport system ATP-binding protein
MIFADEPTGSLDEENGHEVEELLLGLVNRQQATLLLVTHDKDFALRCDTTLELTYHTLRPYEGEEENHE